MDNLSDFLGDLPDDDTAHEVSAQFIPITPNKPGSGQELGEMGIGGFENSDNITTETTFLPRIPTEASYDPRLAFEIALAFEAPEDIYPRYNMAEADWYRVSRQPVFRADVVRQQDDIAEKGITYRMKARTQAEAYLKDAHALIKNPMTSQSVRLEAIKWVTKVADLEPKKDKEDTGTTFNLQINL